MLSTRIILTCIKQFQNERSYTAVYHLLRGKKGIQTIQDAHLYELQQFFGIYPQLTETLYQQMIHYFHQERWVEKTGEKQITLTDMGCNFLAHLENSTPFFYIDGEQYREKDRVLWQRLLLLIQVYTHLQLKKRSFLPIVDHQEITSWVKRYYKQQQHDAPQFLNQLYDEIKRLLLNVPNEHANIFVSQLTSAHYIGLTEEQLAHKYQLPNMEVYFITLNILHYILHTIDAHPEALPLLASFTSATLPANSQQPLTISAQKTYELLQRGLSLEQVAQQRRLQLSTIHDHVVEIALHHTTFPIERYIAPHQIKEVHRAVSKVNSRKLKDIKQNISADISYFQIRLALTKLT